MRKVTYKYQELHKTINRMATITGEGFFHGWGVNYEEFEMGAGNFSVAIIERKDGSIIELSPSSIKFVEPTPDNDKKE